MELPLGMARRPELFTLDKRDIYSVHVQRMTGGTMEEWIAILWI